MLKNLRQRLGQSVEELDDERVQQRIAELATRPIGEAPTRTPIVVAGEVQGQQVVPRAGSPSLEVTLGDGTGRAVAVFTGRRRIGGLEAGRRVVLEGVARRERGRLVILNPAYTIVE